MVKISIIIPTLNEEKYIEKTLSALKPQLEKDDEIIVVDSYSQDNTVKIARKFGARVVLIKRCGIGPAKTFGARHAKNEIIAMLDADGIPAKDWLGKIKKHFETDTDAVAGFGVYESKTPLKRLSYNTFAWFIFTFIGRIGYALKKVPCMPANDSAIKKELFFRYGGYHNVVLEDYDFALRARGKINIIYDKSLLVTLSDRRFQKEGFLKMFWSWTKCGIAVVKNMNKTAATDYAIVR
jgi:glycosyltransferase involved in cell wall biosynthesis